MEIQRGYFLLFLDFWSNSLNAKFKKQPKIELA